MRAYSNMPVVEFLDQIRDAAIASKVSPIVLAKIDELYTCPDQDTFDNECGKARDEGYAEAETKAETEADNLKARIKNLERDLSDSHEAVAELEGKLDHALEQLG